MFVGAQRPRLENSKAPSYDAPTPIMPLFSYRLKPYRIRTVAGRDPDKSCIGALCIAALEAGGEQADHSIREKSFSDSDRDPNLGTNVEEMWRCCES